jgi:hypothetical protein
MELAANIIGAVKAAPIAIPAVLVPFANDLKDRFALSTERVIDSELRATRFADSLNCSRAFMMY